MSACLLDTNVLLYLANPAAREHAAAKVALARMLSAADEIVVSLQVLLEFWSVATRPAVSNGLGWSVPHTRAVIEEIRARFPVLDEPPEVLDLWLELVVAHAVKGKRIHDAHLLATMKANGVTRLLTFNDSDFPSVPGLSILTPDF
ncbi:MAG: PIN domain-containing protein [Acidobacteriota bacterium]